MTRLTIERGAPEREMYVGVGPIFRVTAEVITPAAFTAAQIRDAEFAASHALVWLDAVVYAHSRGR